MIFYVALQFPIILPIGAVFMGWTIITGEGGGCVGA